jgi:DNA-binding NarL/FixJ family response regulator
MQQQQPQIFLVGHCNYDGPRLQQLISTKFPDARVTRINTDQDLRQACESPDALLLVNREPVGFDCDGLDIIRDVCKQPKRARAMLVSDYDDAQQEAQTAGALPGFGKREIGKESLIERIRGALAGRDSTASST